jgi:chromosome segregation ATPase
VSKERDDTRTQFAELKRRAEALVKKHKDLEASVETRVADEAARADKLQNDVRAEREARNRDRAQMKANEESLREQITALESAAEEAQAEELTSMKAQLDEKDEQLEKANAEYASMREKAKEALNKLKILDEKVKAGGSDKEQVTQLREKYNEAVGKLKQQAELNKKIDEKFRELADKHRKALMQLQQLQLESQARHGTQSGEGEMTETTLVVPKPKKP